MKNQSVYNKLTVQADNILEVRLNYGVWNRIKVVATSRNCSYSWVVRFAVFRLIKRSDLKAYVNRIVAARGVENFNRVLECQRQDSANKHRHKLCLYGNDELYLRLAAAQLGCTMTHLVRLALMVYLDDLTPSISFCMYNLSRWGVYGHWVWYWLGIKLFADVELPTRGTNEKYFRFKPYKREDYW